MKHLVLILLISSSFVTLGCRGPKGDAGVPGPAGEAGVEGPSGTPGAPGLDAPPTPYTPVALLNPCGDAAGISDEVLIQLASGQIVVSFSDSSNGNNTRFSVLAPGSYVTTDGDSCYFTVSADGELVNEHH